MHGCKYALVLIDGYSRYAYVVPRRQKSDALNAFKMFVQDVGKPRELLSDCDSVFLGAPFSTYCTEQAIRQVDSIPHRQHMNGIAERGNKELKTIAKALLLDSGLPSSMWAYALCTAAYLKNRTSGIHGKTPYQLMTPVSYGSPPKVSHLRVWGSPCFAYIEKDQRKPEHHNAVSQASVFIGYDLKNDGYLVYNPVTKHVMTRDTVKFDETYVGGVDVLKGVYTKTPEQIEAPTFDAPGRPKRPKPTQADVNKLFSPSVELSNCMKSPHRHKLESNIDRLTCKPAQYIIDRVSGITASGRSFDQASKLRFKDSSGKFEYYKRKDLNYDLKHGYLRYEGTGAPLQSSEVLYHRDNMAAAREIHDAHALIQTGDEPLTRREARARPDWSGWWDCEQVEWNRVWPQVRTSSPCTNGTKHEFS